LGGVICSFPFVVSTDFAALKINPPVTTGTAPGWKGPPVTTGTVGMILVPKVNPDPENTPPPVVTLGGSLSCVPGFTASHATHVV
jgi:hypothetical protein